MRKYKFDIWNDELREDWVEIPCDEDDPEQGTTRLKLKQLPDKEWEKLCVIASAATKATVESSRAMVSEADPLAVVELWKQEGDRTFDAKAEMEASKQELVAKMVVDHDASQFIVQLPEIPEGKRKEKAIETLRATGLSDEEIAQAFEDGYVEVKFECQEWTYKKQPQRGASPRMMKLYADSDAFFLSIYHACERFQTLVDLTPAEIWEQRALARTQTKKHFSFDVPAEKSQALLLLLSDLGLSTDEIAKLSQEGSVFLRFPKVEEAPSPLAQTTP